MQSNNYDDLLIRVENDLIKRNTIPVISDNVDLFNNSDLEGVTFIKGNKTYIFIDKNLDYFNKARTLVEEYFHAISDLGNHLDYSNNMAQNDEVAAREDVISYLTDETTILSIAQNYEGQPIAAWMLTEHLGYPQEFAEETLDYYRRHSILN